MRNKYSAFLIAIILAIMILFESVNPISAESTSAPYYTYTADSKGNLIQTMEAYTPGIQINSINDLYFDTLEHIFIDKDDYVYITDSKVRSGVDQYDPITGDLIINEITGNPALKYYIGKITILDEDLNYVTELIDDSLNFPKSTFVDGEKIYVVDFTSQNIYIYDKSKLIDNNEVVLLQVIVPPTHPIFLDKYNDEGEKISSGYRYQPDHIAVDSRGNIYVQGLDSKNGLIMLDDEGSFMTFFGGNPYRIPIIDKIRSIFLTEEQEEKMLDLRNEKIYHDIPSNIAIDDKGYIYTVTSSIPSNPIKKFNVNGTNYFNSDMIGTTDMSSIWIGNYNNVYAINGDGYIFEYDTNGNLLFFFGGRDFTSSRVGLLTSPVSIASNSNDILFVVDKASKLIQVYNPTPFTNAIHNAFKSYYDEGDYEQSLEDWKYILEYNSMFDYAHIGLGDSYMREEDYFDAYNEYFYAKDYVGISDAFWNIRQEWLKENLNLIFSIIVSLVFVRIVHGVLNKYYHYSKSFEEFIKKLRSKYKTLDELLYIFTFLKQPLNGFYEIKRENRISVSSATIIYFILGLLFVVNYQYTNIIFMAKDNVNIPYELAILVMVLILWVVSNYLVCTINDGEGSIKNVYIATAYSLSPILVMLPTVIILSNILTLQESVFYVFGYFVMYIWTIFLAFFMIKDIHNYSVSNTVGVILKSMFTMLILGLFIFIINSLENQMFNVVKDIIVEVIIQ